MIVALTVGLSVASRTVTNLKISNQNDESQKAFSAAEAGIEQAINAASGTAVLSNELGNSSQFSTTIAAVEGTSLLLNGGEKVEQDSGVDIWLSNYPNYSSPTTGTITIFWGDDSQNTCSKAGGNSIYPSIEVVTLSGSVSDPTVSKNIFDGCARIAGALSAQGGGSVSSKNFNYSADISFVNGLLMRVIPVFNSSEMAITSSIALPSQGKLIESVGKSGDTVRKIQYFVSHPQLPLEIFPYSIISQ